MQPQPSQNTVTPAFSSFSWALVLLCFPIALWPFSLLLSPHLFDNPALSQIQMQGLSFIMWIYPVILVVFARLLYVLHQNKPHLAKIGLIFALIATYSVIVYTVILGFN